MAQASRDEDTNSEFGIDSDDDLSVGERAAKRRRVEEIADRYKRGLPVYMVSTVLKGPFEGDGSKRWANPWRRETAPSRILRAPNTAQHGSARPRLNKKVTVDVPSTSQRPKQIEKRSNALQTRLSTNERDSADWLRTTSSIRESLRLKGTTPELPEDIYVTVVVSQDQSPSRRLQPSKSSKLRTPAIATADISPHHESPRTTPAYQPPESLSSEPKQSTVSPRTSARRTARKESKEYPQSTSSQGFAFRIPANPPLQATSAHGKAVQTKLGILPQRKTLRRVSFKDTPAAEERHRAVTSPKEHNSRADKPQVVAPEDVVEGIVDQLPAVEIVLPVEPSEPSKDSGGVQKKSRRKSGRKSNIRDSVVHLENEPELPSTPTSRNDNSNDEPAALEADDFCTQAAVLEAQRAFQDGITPLHERVVHYANSDPIMPGTPVRSTPIIPRLSPIVPLRAFGTPTEGEPPVSTQELIDAAARDLAFSTIKRPGRRASFISDSYILATTMKDNGSPLRTARSTRYSLRSPSGSPTARRSTRKAHLANGLSPKMLAQFVTSGSPVATFSPSARVTATLTSDSRTVPAYSQNAQPKSSRLSRSFSFGQDIETNSVIDATIDDLSGYLSTWDPEKEVLQMMREDKENKRRASRKTIDVATPALKSSLRKSGRRSSAKV